MKGEIIKIFMNQETITIPVLYTFRSGLYPDKNGRVYTKEVLAKTEFHFFSYYHMNSKFDITSAMLYYEIFTKKPYKLITLRECWRLWKNLHNEPTYFPNRIKVPNWFKYELKKILTMYNIHWYIEDSSFSRKAGATNDIYRICAIPVLLTYLCDIERPIYKGE